MGSKVLQRFQPERAIGKVLDWFTIFVDRVVSTKKVDMYNRRPGSISPGEPKFIWLKMINRFQGSSVLMQQRTCFTAMLEEAIASKCHVYIMDLGDVIKPTSFDRNSSFRATARIEIWAEINQQIELFDKQKLSLRPAPRKGEKESKRNECSSSRSSGQAKWQTKY